MIFDKDLVKLKYDGVEVDIETRWENGVDHHQKSKDLFHAIEELDFHFNDDFFSFKSGGDGDNGEFLMYLFDIYFEKQDLENG